MDDANRYYARLPDSDVDPEIGRSEAVKVEAPQFSLKKWSRLCWLAKVVFLGLLVVVVAAVLIFYIAPFLINMVIKPILDWETATFSRPILALLLFVSIATFPSLLLPSAPSMWIAGVTFGYWYGFLLIMAGISLGMSFPFFVGSLFRSRIHSWLEKCPEKAAIIRLAGEGDWFHQFRAVALIRISPFPYIIFNYAAVATNVKYGPYISGSLAGTVHEIFLTIYSGILIWSVADATNKGGFLSVQQLIYDGVGLCVAIAATAIITFYSKRALRNLQVEDESTICLR